VGAVWGVAVIVAVAVGALGALRAMVVLRVLDVLRALGVLQAMVVLRILGVLQALSRDGGCQQGRVPRRAKASDMAVATTARNNLISASINHKTPNIRVATASTATSTTTATATVAATSLLALYWKTRQRIRSKQHATPI
jgi:hypothetical protein